MIVIVMNRGDNGNGDGYGDCVDDDGDGDGDCDDAGVDGDMLIVKTPL